MSQDMAAQFPTTRWTLVERLRSPDGEEARRALDELVVQYHYTLYAYIRRRGLSPEDAEDALHDFLVKLLRARALEGAEAPRGRLRGLLGMALGRFLAGWLRSAGRRARAQVDTAGEMLVDDATTVDEERYAKECFSEDDTAEMIFDRKWGHALMARVVMRLRMQCHERGKGAIFSALRPVLVTGGSLRSHDAAAIAARLGISVGALRVTLSRHLQDYRAILEDEVLQTVERPEDVADEIAHLMSVFGKQ